ncbi:MAG: outer membrane protein assembly factor [Bacteroidales bacterium]|jgi:hypothetical protein|nr:outer membrane protein assembly factor [Bacteroidales bacterium]
MKKHLLLLCVLFLSSFGFAQNSNSIASPDTTQTSLFNATVERTLSFFEWHAGKTTIFTLPSFGYDPASGFALGVQQIINFPHRDTSAYKRSTTLFNYISYSTNNWFNIRSSFNLYSRSGWAFYTRVQYQQSPDKFFGIGQSERNRNPQAFDIKLLQIQGNASHSLFWHELFAGVIYDLTYADISNVQISEDFLPENKLAEQKNKVIFGIGPYIAYDSRDNVHFPSRGNFITTGVFLYPKFNSRSYGFVNYMLDARTYIPLYSKQILALQFFAGTSQGDMPFYKLYQLGGTERLRGISNKYMYIDTYVYYTQAELRQHLWGRFSAVAFGGVGNAFGDFKTMNDFAIKYIYGMGARVQTGKHEKINLRVDYARARFRDSGLYITVSESF